MDRDPQIVAADADRLLNDPVLKGAFEEVEALLIQKMKYAAIIDNPHANEYRDKLILSLQALGLVQDKLVEFIETGMIARSQKPEEI